MYGSALSVPSSRPLRLKKLKKVTLKPIAIPIRTRHLNVDKALSRLYGLSKKRCVISDARAWVTRLLNALPTTMPPCR